MERDVKTLVKDYYLAYEQSRKLPELRTALINKMKSEHVTDKAFEIGGVKIAYKHYEDKEGMSQKFIKTFLEKHYPDINAVEFMGRLCAERTVKQYETIRVVPVVHIKPT
jgi:hypothetical protein